MVDRLKDFIFFRHETPGSNIFAVDIKTHKFYKKVAGTFCLLEKGIPCLEKKRLAAALAIFEYSYEGKILTRERLSEIAGNSEPDPILNNLKNGLLDIGLMGDDEKTIEANKSVRIEKLLLWRRVGKKSMFSKDVGYILDKIKTLSPQEVEELQPKFETEIKRQDVPRDESSVYQKAESIIVHGDVILGVKISENKVVNVLPNKNLENAEVSPYPFLFSYRHDDRKRFYGRDQHIQKLTNSITNKDIIILYGYSGAGKTSLMNAGVLPMLKDKGYFGFSFQNYENILGKFRYQLEEEYGEQFHDSEEKWDWLERLFKKKGCPLYFFFDQFERFFQQSQELQKEFMLALSGLIEKTYLAKFTMIFSLRSDYFGNFGEFQEVLPIFSNDSFKHFLPALSMEEAKSAIELPLAELPNRVEYDENFLNKTLLPDLCDNTNKVLPPRLQIVCGRLYDEYLKVHKSRQPKHKTFVIDDLLYNSLGGTKGILLNYLDDKLETYQENLGLAKTILKAMIPPVTSNLRMKQFVAFEDITQLVDQDSAIMLLNRLVNDRLVEVARQDENVTTYSIAHEYMISEIEQWFSEDEQKIQKASGLLMRAMVNWSQFDTFLDKMSLLFLDEIKDKITFSQQHLELILCSRVFHDLDLSGWKEMLAVDDFKNMFIEMLDNKNEHIRLAGVKGFRFF